MSVTFEREFELRGFLPFVGSILHSPIPLCTFVYVYHQSHIEEYVCDCCVYPSPHSLLSSLCTCVCVCVCVCVCLQVASTLRSTSVK